MRRMKPKKGQRAKGTEESMTENIKDSGISTKAELTSFIRDVRDKLLKEQAPAIFAMSAMQYVMNLDDIHGMMDTEIKEILQEIWVKLSQSGFHLRKPPLLFADSEASGT